jgi:peptidoglycan/LPS O-acetylase OafA/YrhL
VHSGHWWVYYGLLQDLRVPWIEGGLKAAWSLCTEAQFYVLLPVYALVCARWLTGRSAAVQARAELGALTFLAALSLLVRSVSFADRSPDVVSSTIAGTFLWFAVGMALAVASARWHRVPVAARPVPLRTVAQRPGLAWVVSAALLLAVTQIGMPTTDILSYDDGDWFFGHLFYAGIAATFALPAMLGDPAGVARGVPARVLGRRPVAWLGLVSYGIFLWHQPLCEKLLKVQDWTSHGSFVVYTVVVAAVATACATVSYYLVERPLLRFKDPRRVVSRGGPGDGRAGQRRQRTRGTTHLAAGGQADGVERPRPRQGAGGA